MTDVPVQLLFTPGCPHAERAERLLRAVLGEEAPDSVLDVIAIQDLDHAASAGFHGSPTVRVGGRDVVAPDGAPPALGCRLYVQADGTRDGVPPESAIRGALGSWSEQQKSSAKTRAGLGEVPARALRAGFMWASRRRSLERLTTALPLTRGLVERFVAGEDLARALGAVERLHDAGRHTTVDVLGESVETEDAARAAADRYIETLRALSARHLDANVSLKLTQMGLDVDPGFCRSNVGRVIAQAAECGAFVRVDMEDHTRTDRTLEIARSLHREYPHVGVVMQSYLRRTAADVELLIGEGIRVRLCKGAYNEPADVAFPSKAEVDENYVVLMERLLREGNYPALATHDERIVAHAREFALREGIGPERFEFQMLYGVRRDLEESLVAAGYTVRVYVPYGRDWYAYFMRRLGERPANVLFLLRNIAREAR